MEEIEYDMTNDTNKTVYAVPNPYWLSDTFVFREDDELGSVYVKLNCEDKIEEIGVDISRRMHGCPVGKIIDSEHCAEANDVQKTILNSIGEEYWHKIKNQ